jgi:vitamin B12 transporter
VENIQRARTRGAEISAQVSLGSAADARVSYTYLEAENRTAHTRLLRRPRHRASADIWRDFGRGVTAGVGAAFVAQREDVHAQTFRTIDGEDYSVARVYAAWQATPRLAVKVRMENVLDEKYEEVHGYPALGRGAFAGVEWKF